MSADHHSRFWECCDDVGNSFVGTSANDICLGREKGYSGMYLSVGLRLLNLEGSDGCVRIGICGRNRQLQNLSGLPHSHKAPANLL